VSYLGIINQSKSGTLTHDAASSHVSAASRDRNVQGTVGGARACTLRSKYPHNPPTKYAPHTVVQLGMRLESSLRVVVSSAGHQEANAGLLRVGRRVQHT
jgi:hypothetical protein